MIWHIFRKDWKLLWWKALIVPALLVISAIAQTSQGHFGATPKFAIVPLVVGFGAAILLTMELVQLDPLAGAGQDWIARPLARMDLLLAKILFILLTIALPMLLTEMVQDMAVGIPFGRALWGATFDTVSGVLSIGLPALAFASLFRNLTETIAAIFIAIVALFAVGFAIQGNARFPLAGAETGSDVQWIVDLIGPGFYFAGALIVFAIQYFRRRTILARCVAATVFLLVCFTSLLPWGAAFAVEQRLSPMPGAGANANIFYNPSSGRASDAMNAVCIPIAVSGVADGSWLNIDSVKASLLDGDTTVWTRRVAGAIEAGTSMWGHMRGSLMGTKSSGSCQPIEPIDIPRDELKGFEDRPIRVQLDYSLTLFGPDKSYAMPAVGGDQRMPGVGWCQTRGRDPLEIGCISDNGPACLEAWTANAPASTAWFCRPDYDAVRGVDTDPWGGTLGLKVQKGDTLVIRNYRPLDHFERVVTTSEIKLHDWITASQ